MYIIKSIFYFLLAGLFEIGGGYLIWQWLREGKSLWYALAGAIVLLSLPCSRRETLEKSMPPMAEYSSSCPCFGAGVSTTSHQTVMILLVPPLP